MIEKIVAYMVQSGAVAQEDADVQVYALRSLIEMVTTHGLILVLAAVFRALPQTAVFYLIFLPLRSYAGGFHAETAQRCLVLSVAVWAAVAALGRALPYELTLPTLAAAVALILWLAPIEHRNNPQSARGLQRARRVSCVLVAVDATLVLALLLPAPTLALTGALSLLSIALSLVAARKAA